MSLICKYCLEPEELKVAALCLVIKYRQRYRFKTQGNILIIHIYSFTKNSILEYTWHLKHSVHISYLKNWFVALKMVHNLSHDYVSPLKIGIQLYDCNTWCIPLINSQSNKTQKLEKIKPNTLDRNVHFGLRTTSSQWFLRFSNSFKSRDFGSWIKNRCTSIPKS